MRTNKLWMVLVLLLVAFLAACGGGEEEAAAPEVELETVTAADLGIALGHPAGWVVEQAPLSLMMASSAELMEDRENVQTGALLTVMGQEKETLGMVAGTGADMDDPMVVLELFTDVMMSEGGTGDEFTVREEATAVTYGGNSAARAVFDVKSDNFDGVAYFIAIPNGELVVYLLAATPKTEADSFEPTLEAILNSVQLSTPQLPESAVAEEVAVVEPEPEPTAEPEPTEEPTAVPTATTEPTAEPTPEPTPEPTAEPTAEPMVEVTFTEAITSASLGYSIGIPEGWASQDNGGGTLELAFSEEAMAESDGNLDGPMVTTIGIEREFVSFMSTEEVDMDDPVSLLTVFTDLLEMEALGDESTFSELVRRDDPQAVTLAGLDGAQIVYDVTIEDETGVVVLSVIPGEDVVVFFLGASPVEQEADNMALFTSMMNSMVFGEPLVLGEPVLQWAVNAEASSQYTDTSWSAMQATGEPDTLECGDNSTAWASSSSIGVDWLELTFETAVYVQEIHIYQTYNPDQVVLVELRTPEGEYVSVYETIPLSITDYACPYVLFIPLDGSVIADGVRVTVDQSQLNVGWNEIDAVQLIGPAAP